MFGPSGSGKGTQATLLKQELLKHEIKVDHIQSGEILRTFMASGEPLAAECKAYTEAGKLVPSMIVNKLLVDMLIDDICTNTTLIFDGYPRNYTQAQMLDNFLTFANRDYEVIFFTLSKEEAVDRMMSRGRADDSRESIVARLDWYFEAEKKVMEFWKEEGVTIHTVDASQSVEDIHAHVLSALNIKK